MLIHTIDLHFQDTPKVIAAYLVETDAGPILMETGPHSCLSSLHAGIKNAGFAPQDIKHVFLTHIHLDHAGAAWTFAEAGATIYVHPFGYPHMADPSRFVASAKMIYKERMDKLWGDIKSIDENKLQAVADLETIKIGHHRIISHHTPGHAKHHIAWQLEEHLFAGDVAGISIQGGPVVPPCPPPDINMVDWKASIEKLKDLKEVSTYHLAHFGEITEPAAHLESLAAALDQYAQFIHPYFLAGDSMEEILPHFESFVMAYLQKNGVSKEETLAYASANPADMNVTGLLRYWKKHGDH